MKVLLLSNQGMREGMIGNPILLRTRDALLSDPHVEEVYMLRCNNPFSVMSEMRKKAKEVDIIHVHFGGVYSLIVWLLLLGIKKAKIITFHGTDIHAKALKTSKSIKERIRIRLNQKASFFCIVAYDKCGFVAEEMLDYVPSLLKKRFSKKFFYNRLGVDYNVFCPASKESSQQALGLLPDNYILFSDIHNSTIKRRDIAESIVKEMGGRYKLLVMCGVSPNEVPLYLNACDCVLLTSDEEGSPNIIREALSVNKPVFSVDVGDAKQQLHNLNNSAIIDRNPRNAAQVIKRLLSLDYSDNTRGTMKESLDFSCCIKQTIYIYQEELKTINNKLNI